MTDAENAEAVKRLWEASQRAQDRVQAYFARRRQSQHDIDGIKQPIADATYFMCKAAEGVERAQHARNPVAYLSQRIIEQTSVGSTRRRAENRYALELLADELGIKDDVLKALARTPPRSL